VNLRNRDWKWLLFKMSWTISNIDELSAWLIHPRFINELSWPSSNWISFFILLGRALKNAKYRDIAEGSLKILTPDENTMREHEEEIEEDRYSGFPVLVSGVSTQYIGNLVR
jgi:hypothetical protein